MTFKVNDVVVSKLTSKVGRVSEVIDAEVVKVRFWAGGAGLEKPSLYHRDNLRPLDELPSSTKEVTLTFITDEAGSYFIQNHLRGFCSLDRYHPIISVEDVNG